MDDILGEVREELAKDAFTSFVRKRSKILLLFLLGALAIGLGAFFFQKRQNAALSATALRYQRVLQDMADAQEKGIAPLEALLPSAPPSYRPFIQFRLAGAYEKTDPPKAAALFRVLGSDLALPGALQDLAMIRWSFLESQSSPSERIAQLEPLTAQGRPFRLLAFQQIGFAAAESGDFPKARASFEALANAPEASFSLKEKAEIMLSWLPEPQKTESEAKPLPQKGTKDAPERPPADASGK